MDANIKVSIIHIFTAFIAAFLAAYVSLGLIPFFGKNEWLGAFFGILILYITGQICERFFDEEEFGGFRQWLSKGIIPFIFVWFVMWTMLMNSYII